MYRLERSHLFLQQSFRSAGPTRKAIQNVLQSLRWDPLDDRLIGLGFDPAREARPYSSAGRQRHDDRQWHLGAGPALPAWAERHGLSWQARDGGEVALGGCWLLELSCCSRPSDRRDEAAITRYRAGGGRSLFASDDGFYWASSYHLALPGQIRTAAPDARDLWHAEGGLYRRKAGAAPGGTWIRRRQAWRERDDDERRPADQFDPRADTRFEGLGDGLAFDLAPDSAPLALTPFIARLGYLVPWPPNPLLRPADDVVIEAAQGRPLAAWFLPRDERRALSWQVSPPLEF